MKGDRVPIEEQKKRKADYQRRRIAEKRAQGIRVSNRALVPDSQKIINMEEKKRKHREWIESPEGKEFFKKVSIAKTKHKSAKDRDKYWGQVRKNRIHTDLRTCLAARLNGCKYRAKVKGVPFDLTVDYLLEIYTEFCPILGIKMDFSGQFGKNAGEALSIDRIIPEFGYVKGNVMLISYQANKMKSDASIELLLTFARNILSIYSEEQKGVVNA